MNAELHQQLIEFVYGLLDEDEANALCERITSDPQVARAYATVKLQCDLVARAARYDTPTVSWSRPNATTSSIANVQSAAQVLSDKPYRRFANWCIGVAASGLICLVASAYWMSTLANRNESTSLASAAVTPVQVVLTGPSKLHTEAANTYTLEVENQAGAPVSATFNYRIYNTNGVVSWEDSTSTDAFGVARFDVDAPLAHDASRLEITTAANSPVPIRRELEASPEQFVTYLRMDRPLFQPGERVSYRAVALSRFGLRSDREVKTSFEIVNAAAEPMEGAAKTNETELGVGSGTFNLPSDLPDGTYTLIVRSPDNLFREEWHDFHVRRYEAPRLLTELELARDSYTLGDQVELDFSVKRVAGEPLAEVPLQIQASLDGKSLATPEARTDADGNSRFSLSLPELIERGDASVSVTVQAGDDLAETITREIPINLGKVNVDFYPEGGDLAANVPNRVYFYGRDPLGKPAHIEGRIVDSNDKAITEVTTGHEGRGMFSFTPAIDERYRLMIDKPAGVTKEIPLPAASPIRLTIDTGPGVFDANAPIAFTLHMVYPVEPLVVAAYCRGAMVGQQTLDDDAYAIDHPTFATFRGELDLPPEAQGVIRLTVFDSSSTPPTPIAERLVYRRVGQRLDVQFTPDAETFTPGQDVKLDLAVRDENSIPVTAALGIAIVDDAVLNLADDQSIRMPTYFHLLTEIDSPEQLEDANFYMADKSESATALDSLLGTQGWRRFRDLPATQLAETSVGGFGGGGIALWSKEHGLGWRHRPFAWAEETVVPLSTATTMDVQEITVRQSAPSARATSSSRQPFALPIIIASFVLLVLVGAASSRWTSSNHALRVFAVAVAVVSLLVGVFSLPAKVTRMDQTTDIAARVSGHKVASAAGAASAVEEAETAIVAENVEKVLEAPAAGESESLMLRAGAGGMASNAPQAAAPTGPAPFRPLPVDPQGVARFAAPEKQPGLGADAAINEKTADKDLPPSKNKYVGEPSLEAQPRPKSAAKLDAPRSETDALAGVNVATAEHSKSIADSDEGRFQTREYAEWFYKTRTTVSPTAQSSSTIFWVPLFVADETGKATVYFTLPQHASSFRAIVEAHGAGRLGSGELLINSQAR